VRIHLVRPRPQPLARSSLPILSLYSPPDPRHLHSFPTRRSSDLWRTRRRKALAISALLCWHALQLAVPFSQRPIMPAPPASCSRSEEHTSELQSRENLVCRLLLEKKKKTRDKSECSKKTRSTTNN